MLNKSAAALLRVINGLCKDGEYKIFSIEDFEEELPKVDREKVKEILSELSINGYVVIKYAGEELYCLRPLPLGQIYSKKEEEERFEYRERLGLIILTAFFGAFFGALLGLMIFLLVSRLFF